MVREPPPTLRNFFISVIVVARHISRSSAKCRRRGIGLPCACESFTVTRFRMTQSESDLRAASTDASRAPESAALSPAMRQYQQFKSQYPGYVLFFRMG